MKTILKKTAGLFFLFPFLIFSQTKWQIKSEKNFDFVIETKIDGNKITGNSRENAIKDYFSMIEYMVVKKKYNLESPEFIRLEGKSENGKEFIGILSELRNKYALKLTINGDEIQLELKDPKNKVSILKGRKLTENFVHKDYKKLGDELFQKIETNIFDRKYLQTSSYVDFKKDFNKNTTKIVDDYEFQYDFLISAIIKRKLDFSHLSLVRKERKTTEGKLIFKEISSKTALLDIDAFNGKREKIDSLIQNIKGKNYSNLIIDLRNNPGGNFETSLPLGNYLNDKELIVGYFPNQKWYNSTDKIPTKADLGKLNEFRDGSLEDFYAKAADKLGAYLITTPEKDNFKGKIYILTNEGTASTAEVFTISMKEENRATIVGSKTAGVLLSAKAFSLDENFEVIIPTNDFISAKGFRVDRVGISPDIETGKEDALDFVLKNLIK